MLIVSSPIHHKRPLPRRVGINRRGLNQRQRKVVSHKAGGEGGLNVGNQARSGILHQSSHRPGGFSTPHLLLLQPPSPQRAGEKGHQHREGTEETCRIQEVGSGQGVGMGWRSAKHLQLGLPRHREGGSEITEEAWEGLTTSVKTQPLLRA